MAKRAPVGETPYRPLLDPSVLNAALSPVAQSAPVAEPQRKIVELAKPVIEQRKVEEPKAPLEAQVARVTLERKAPQADPAFSEKLDQERRLLLTRSESQAVDRLVSSLATRLNTQVKASHVLRAMVTLLLNSEGEVDRRAGEIGALTRPPNGDLKGLQKFEADIANIIGAGIRDAGPLR